jgi:hypothetical protein
MLDVWQSRPPSGAATGYQLQVQVPIGTGLLVGTYALSRPAQAGVYPISFTLWNTGSYDASVTSNGVHVQGSPCSITVINAPVDPTSSLAYGIGLVGGIAGEQIAVEIQAKDERQTSIQYITSMADVADFVAEEQKIAFSTTATEFTLSFRGSTTTSLTVGTSTVLALKTAIARVLSEAVIVYAVDGSIALDADVLIVGEVSVEFAEVLGDVPLMVSSDATVTVTETIKGYAPFRQTVQVVTLCSPDSNSDVTMAYGGSSVTFTKTTLVSEVETIITDAFGTTISISTTDLTAIPVSGIQFCDEAGTVPMTLTFEHVKALLRR